MNETNPDESQKTKALVAQMYDEGLNHHVVEGMERYWTEDMHWYGPAGIGHKLSLRAFQEEHQKPFLHAFPDKAATDEIRIAEGHYAAAKGFQERRSRIRATTWAFRRQAKR